jgi:hypothetical protein
MRKAAVCVCSFRTGIGARLQALPHCSDFGKNPCERQGFAAEKGEFYAPPSSTRASAPEQCFTIQYD